MDRLKGRHMRADIAVATAAASDVMHGINAAKDRVPLKNFFGIINLTELQQRHLAIRNLISRENEDDPDCQDRNS